MEKLIKMVTASIFALTFLIGVENVFAEEYETPHTLQPGDVISADVLNEMFEEIENTKKVIALSGLIGTWSCTKFIGLTDMTGYNPAYQAVENSAFFHYLNLTLTIVNDGDGTYSWSSAPYSAFLAAFDGGGYYLDNCEGSGSFEAYYNNIAASSNDCGGGQDLWLGLTATIPSNTRIIIRQTGTSISYPTLTCDKQDLPPNKPTRLSANASEFTITLSWTDNSSDETGFKIMRKDQLEGSYANIGTVSANVTSYTDTLPTAGKYWYRVKATNANGDSTGSNVDKVTISE